MVMKVLGNRNETGISFLFHNTCFIRITREFHYRFIIVECYEMVMKILGNHNEMRISLLFYNIHFIRVTGVFYYYFISIIGDFHYLFH